MGVGQNAKIPSQLEGRFAPIQNPYVSVELAMPV